MYGCESWTIKKAEHWRIDAFELWCWRRLLRVPWTARRSNQSILKEISPGSSLEELMLKLKLESFGHLMWRVDSLEKTLMLGKIEGRRRREQQRMRVAKSRIWLSNWTELNWAELTEIRDPFWINTCSCCDLRNEVHFYPNRYPVVSTPFPHWITMLKINWTCTFFPSELLMFH